MSKPTSIRLGLALAIVASAQDQDRDLWNPEFRRARVGSKTVTPAFPQFIGITLWRLRPSKSGDQERLLDHEDPGAPPAPLTPERIGINTLLLTNDRVRISVQSARQGYLYVVSQEQYKGGQLGPPSLIFPSMRIRDGHNLIAPGQAIEIPESSNRRPYFTLKRSRPDHEAETISVLVSARPIPGLVVQSGYLPIDPAVWDDYKKKWGVKVRRLENTAVGSWTTAERAAAENAGKLKPSDPLPQMLFKGSSVDGLLTSLSLLFSQ